MIRVSLSMRKFVICFWRYVFSKHWNIYDLQQAGKFAQSMFSLKKQVLSVAEFLVGFQQHMKTELDLVFEI